MPSVTARPGRQLEPAPPLDISGESVEVAIALLVHAAGLHEDRGNLLLARGHLAHAQTLARARARALHRPACA